MVDEGDTVQDFDYEIYSLMCSFALLCVYIC